MNRHVPLLRCLALGAVALAACSAHPSTPTALPTEAASTSIPGFEDWSVFNAEAVDVQVEDGTLVLTLKHRALWFMSQRGVLVYKPVSGNFKISVEVIATKSSDPAQPPGDGSSVQLGGLMARDGGGGQENYVFIVVGEDSDGLSVETKTTVDGLSKWNGPAWDSGTAELRLCRFNETFNLFKRRSGTGEAWILAESYQRPDLPETLQVGANIYTDNTPDLRVRYEDLRIEPVSDEAECTTE